MINGALLLNTTPPPPPPPLPLIDHHWASIFIVKTYETHFVVAETHLSPPVRGTQTRFAYHFTTTVQEGVLNSSGDKEEAAKISHRHRLSAAAASATVTLSFNTPLYNCCCCDYQKACFQVIQLNRSCLLLLLLLIDCQLEEEDGDGEELKDKRDET